MLPSTSIPVLAADVIPVMLEPLIVKVPLLLTEPVLVMRTPPTPAFKLSANKPKLEAAPLVVNAPLTMMLRIALKSVAEVKFNVPNVKSVPLPCSVMLPAPTIGEALNATPPPTVNVPPEPVPVFNTPLSINAVILFGLAALALIEPPLVLIPALMVRTRAELSGVNVVKLTLPPVVEIKPEVVKAPVFVTATLPVPLLCVIPVTVNVLAVLVNEISPLVAFVAFKLLTVLAPFNVVPPIELVVNKFVLIAPVCVIAPFAFNDKLPPIEDAPTTSAVLFVKAASLAPVLLSDTAPTKLLLVPFVDKLIVFAPALIFDVPATAIAAD